MKPQVFVLVFASVCTTCIPIRSISSTHQYNVYITPGFTDDERQLIRESFQEWETETRGIVSFTEVSRLDNSQALITVGPSTKKELDAAYHDGLIGRCNYRGANSNNLIATDLDRRDFYQTSLHEFGHSVGLDHDENSLHYHETTMMAHTDDSSTHLTCRDMQAFCKVWGCNALFLPLCQVKIFPDEKM